MEAILDNEIKTKIMKRYVEILKTYHISKHLNAAHIIENDTIIRELIQEAYSDRKMPLTLSKLINIIHRTINRTMNMIKQGELQSLSLSEEEIKIIKNVERKKAIIPPSNKSEYNYNNAALTTAIESIYRDYGEEKFSSVKSRPLLYELIKERYFQLTKSKLSVNNKVLSSKVSRMHLFRADNRVNSSIRKYVSDKYNKGVRLMFIDLIIRDLNLRNDGSVIKEAINEKEFPGLKFIRTKEYILPDNVLEILKEDDFRMISEELIIKLKVMLPHANYTQLCYIIANNYKNVFKKRYNSKAEEDSKIATFRGRLRDRRRSAKYLDTMKQKYNIDVLAW